MTVSPVGGSQVGVEKRTTPGGAFMVKDCWKESGHGVSHGERALLEMSRIQVVSVNGLFHLPGFGKPFWHFARSVTKPKNRASALLSLLGRHPMALHPRTWIALWNSRASTKI